MDKLILIMKRILVFVALLVTLGATAQPFHGPKTDYQWKMNRFQTDDNYQICTFTYDGRNRLLAVCDSIRGEYEVVDSMTYDEADHMVRLSGWQRLGGVLKNVYYIDYTYNDAGLMATRSNYNNFDGNWELGGVYNYTYNAQNQLVLTTLMMGGMIYQKTEYQYSADGCVLEMWYTYSFETNGLLPSEKMVTTYTNGRKVLVLDSVSDDGSYWTYNGKYTYAYDNDGNCTEYHHFDMMNREVERSIYSYDNAMPLSRTLVPWNPELNRPQTYDNVNACVREAWYSVDIDHVLQYVCDYIYDYSDINVAVQSPMFSRVSVYPNPASDRVMLSGLPEGGVQVQVYDVTGRLLSTRNVSGTTGMLDVSGLVPGGYMLRMRQGASVQHVRLMVR